MPVTHARQHKPSPSPAARLHQENATQEPPEAQPGYDHKQCRAVPSRENVSSESPDAQARTTPTTVGIFNLLTYLSLKVIKLGEQAGWILSDTDAK